MDIVIEMKQEYPDIICGIDFSGSPTDGKFNDFKAAIEKARNNGLKIALHCGEVENSLEIHEMLQFGMDRLGHGTFIKGSNIASISKKGDKFTFSSF